MKRILCVGLVLCLLLLLTVCAVHAPEVEPERHYTHGRYMFAFHIQPVSGQELRDWDFVFTYKGERVTGGHVFWYPLTVFSFESVQIQVAEKAAPDNMYRDFMKVAICRGGSGEKELTVTGTDGRTATFHITCYVVQLGKG